MGTMSKILLNYNPREDTYTYYEFDVDLDPLLLFQNPPYPKLLGRYQQRNHGL